MGEKTGGADEEKTLPTAKTGSEPPAQDASESKKDPNLVTFDGPDDPDNPKNWSKWKKGILAAILTTMAFEMQVA